MTRYRKRIIALLIAVIFIHGYTAHALSASSYDFKKLKSTLGDQDAVIVADPFGQIIFSHNDGTPLIPASSLKLLTALTAFHYLGADYRFHTDFFLDERNNIIIKGYGDPLLISEVIAETAEAIAKQLQKGGKTIEDILTDNSHFDTSILIPGVTDSIEPYDAPNGALCVNFNTVNFRKDDGRYVSAEPQTPLLPMVANRIRKTGLSQGRINLSHDRDEIPLYAGRLFKYFFEQENIITTGSVKLGRATPSDTLILRYVSPFTMKQVVHKMMVYSNNFIANQILIQSGIAFAAPPGTLPKGVAAAREFAGAILNDDTIQIAEGSGIARENRITAKSMLNVLVRFKPYCELLRQNGNDFHKTGTLKDISTRVGYIQKSNSSLYPYVILCNTPGKSANPIIQNITRLLSNLDSR